MRMDDSVSMAVNGASNGTGTPKLEGPPGERARAYQMEMFEESLKRNIVVTVGKRFSFFPLSLLVVYEVW